ncbi:uncharacterized protein LOC117565433 [Drosophila albomicans]|uniref:Uncharacterized protein LOC117565433 n=1 Tax=Drosophila albomicans TaxID=7291 RepID=A0A6P8W9N9_DROAB|nr:uncharacterized protein LOC117565433 [Drosophila albomicans]
MAQIWLDNENAGVNVFPRSNRKTKQTSLLGNNNALLQSGKKNVLSSLDNVINNNKPNVTPFKSNNNNQIWRKSCAPKLSLCKETLQKQMRKQITKDSPPFNEVECESNGQEIVAEKKEELVDFDLFDFMDFPSSKCLNNCHQPASFNWQEPEPLLSEDLIEKLLNYSPAFEKDFVNDDHEIPLYPDDDLELEYNNDFEDISPDLLDDAAPPLPAIFEDDFDLF